MTYFNNALQADKLWWTNSTLVSTNEWGLGAGETPGGGYSADRINTNPNTIVSPHIIAGFIPINPSSKDNLKIIYNSIPASAYTIPSDPARKVLWRYSFTNPALRCGYIQVVDFSTMLYGLTSLPEYLGGNFFDTYNNIYCPSFPLSLNEATIEEQVSFTQYYSSTESIIWNHKFNKESTVKITVLTISGQVLKIIYLLANNNQNFLEIPNNGLNQGINLLRIETFEKIYYIKYIKE